ILAGPALRATTARAARALAVAGVSLALVAGLAGPLAYSVDTAATAHGGAGPARRPPGAGAAWRGARAARPGARGAAPAARRLPRCGGPPRPARNRPRPAGARPAGNGSLPPPAGARPGRKFPPREGCPGRAGRSGRGRARRDGHRRRRAVTAAGVRRLRLPVG